MPQMLVDYNYVNYLDESKPNKVETDYNVMLVRNYAAVKEEYLILKEKYANLASLYTGLREEITRDRAGADKRLRALETEPTTAPKSRNWAELKADVDSFNQFRKTVVSRLEQLDQYHDNNVSRIESLEKEDQYVKRAANSAHIEMRRNISSLENGLSELMDRVKKLEHKDECIQKRADGMDYKREKADDTLFIRVKELEDKIAQFESNLEKSSTYVEFDSIRSESGRALTYGDVLNLRDRVEALEVAVKGKVDISSDYATTVFARLKKLEQAIDRMENDGR